MIIEPQKNISYQYMVEQLKSHSIFYFISRKDKSESLKSQMERKIFSPILSTYLIQICQDFTLDSRLGMDCLGNLQNCAGQLSKMKNWVVYLFYSILWANAEIVDWKIVDDTLGLRQ